ncbi:MAG: CHAP domain-containing protein [Ruminococcaceae bacterium]|nr:CHAP domain-containing protein [Oscillospiraceae bacterium]
MKKFFALSLSISILITATLTSVALTPHGNGVLVRNWLYNDTNYTFSDGYKTSVWYHNFSQLELTENHRNNVLRIAISQLGYHEGKMGDYSGADTASSDNCTEYARIYSKNYNDYCFDWCATFVNWCLNQAHVDYAYGEMSCHRWIEDFFVPEDLYRDGKAYGGTYIPKPADIIFFDWDKTGGWSDHIGFVLYTTDTHVYTIEGNTSDNVGLKSYALSDAQVMGYGTPKYKESTEVTFDYSPSNDFVVGDYIVTDNSFNLYYEADVTSQSEKIPLGAMISCDSRSDGWIHIKYNGVSGYTQSTAMFLLQPAEIEYAETTAPVTTQAPETENNTESATTEDNPQTETEATVNTETEDIATESHETNVDSESDAVSTYDTIFDSNDSRVNDSNPTESISGTDNQHTDNRGCGSTLSVGALGVIGIGAAFIYGKKRKE